DGGAVPHRSGRDRQGPWRAACSRRLPGHPHRDAGAAMMTSVARPLAVALALAAVSQAPARAAETASSGPLLVSGQVPSACRLRRPAEGPGSANITFSANSGAASSVSVNVLVDPNTAKTQSAVGVVQFQVSCTGAHTLTVSSLSGGLVNTTTTTTGT